MNIIASIYIRNNKTVRVKSGDLRTLKVYDDSPIDLLKKFEDVGVKEVYLVDLGSAKFLEKNNFILLEILSQFSKLKINYSGGLRTMEQIGGAFVSGANKVTLGTLPVYDKHQFINCLMTWGNKKIVLAADTINGCLKINGWKQKTKINVFDHIAYFQLKGLLNIKVTDVTRDGTLKGPPLGMYKKIIKKFPNLNLTVGGGIRNLNDIYKLKELGIQNAIFGKAFYEGNISFDDVKNYIKN